MRTGHALCTHSHRGWLAIIGVDLPRSTYGPSSRITGTRQWPQLTDMWTKYRFDESPTRSLFSRNSPKKWIRKKAKTKKKSPHRWFFLSKKTAKQKREKSSHGRVKGSLLIDRFQERWKIKWIHMKFSRQPKKKKQQQQHFAIALPIGGMEWNRAHDMCHG